LSTTIMSATIRLTQSAFTTSCVNFEARIKGIGHSERNLVRTLNTQACATKSRHFSKFQSRHLQSASSLSPGIPSAKKDGAKIRVDWNSSTSSKFHNFWLRDHCRCPQCFHGVTKQRLVNTFEILPGIQPANVKGTENGLEVTWESSSHKSLYDWKWLKTNSYDPLFPEVRSSSMAYGRNPKDVSLWGSNILKAPPTVDHNNVMESDKGVLKMLENIVFTIPAAV